MDRPEEHQIDEAAQRVLRNALPLGWVLREKRPDYGIDYEVEVGTAGKLTGLCFAVQLKGKKRLKVSKGTVGFPVETHHLKYYVDRRRDPVFLVLVDTAASEGYWVFLQRYALHELATTDWRSQTTVTVRIPIAQTLRDTEGLRRAAEQAEGFMTGLRPGAIPAAIEGERRRLESLDPRFRVIIRASEKAASYEMHALEPVRFSVQFKGDAGKTKQVFDDLIGRGLPVMINPGEVEVTGSALVAHVFGHSLTLQQVRKFEGSARLVAVGKNGKEAARIDHVPATVEGGLREVRVHASLPRSPLGLKLTLELPDEASTPLPPATSFLFPSQAWAGQHLLHLAYFDQIAGLFDAVRSGCGLRIELLIDGNPVCAMGADAERLHGLRKVGGFLAVVRRAREIAAWGGINPIFPESFTDEMAKEIDEVHRTVAPSGGRMRAAGMAINITLGREGLKGFLDTQQGGCSDGSLRLEGGGEPMQFMGEKMATDGLVFELTHARLDTPVETLRKQIRRADKGDVVTRWVGNAESEWIVRRHGR